MAVRQSTQFGGLTTDLPPEKTPGGSADVALNVTVNQGKLQKRGGFGQFEDDVAGTGSAVRHLAVARFSAGNTVVVAKCADGVLYQRDSAASVFTAITTGWTHNATDRGWSFTWGDRFFYFDRVGGSRWNPAVNSGTAYKAGLPWTSAGMTMAANVSGSKLGYYHAYGALLNSVTREEGEVCDTPAGVHCYIVDNLGISITNWASIKAADTDREWDQFVIYCTNGNTESANGYWAWSMKAYEDNIIAKTASSASLTLPDFSHDPTRMMRNLGGVPPGARVGCLGPDNQAIYGLVYESNALVPDKIVFSLPGWPMSCPTRREYSVSGRTFYPSFEGWTRGGMDGIATAIACGGGVRAAFTPTAAYQLVDTGGGRLLPRLVHTGKGCTVEGGAVGCTAGVFGLGYRSLLRLTGNSVADLAQSRFSTTLADVPAAYASVGAGAYYSYRDQVWFAVVKSGGTVAKRILVYDLTTSALTVFEPSCLAAGEGITAMCEYSVAGSEPTMLVGTSAGRILQYPTAAVDTVLAGTTVGYAAQWTGYFGQERGAADQVLAALGFHNGANVAGNVTVGLRPMRVGGETVTQTSRLLGKSNKFENMVDIAANANGHFFQVDISSTSSVTTQWTINNIALALDRKD